MVIRLIDPNYDDIMTSGKKLATRLLFVSLFLSLINATYFHNTEVFLLLVAALYTI